MLSSEEKLLDKVEGMMKPTTVKLFEERFKEGYDVETDELYCIWSELKKLKISNSGPIATCEEPLGLSKAQCIGICIWKNEENS